jgi:RHS repeat-associated protein
VSPQGDVVLPMNLTPTMIKSGYLYVYCSNESSVDVYFDNLQVSLTHGPILEETHYYPDGLTMAGISDRAFGKLGNRFHYQGKEMQNKEWYDGTGLEEYDFDSRLYDQQLGIWHNQDPANQYSSPYMAMGNNWINGTDPNGQVFGYDDAIVAGVGFIIGYVGYGLSTQHWGGKALVSGLTDAAIAEAGYLTLGGGLAASGSAAAGADAGAEASFDATIAGAGAGGAGTIGGALTYTGIYSISEASVLSANGSQLQNNSWTTVGLMAGYSAVSSISAGIGSGHIGGDLDQFLGVTSKTFAGAAGSALGGFISTAGDNTLESYDPKTDKWNINVGNIALQSLYQGAVGSYFGKVGANIASPVVEKAYANLGTGQLNYSADHWLYRNTSWIVSMISPYLPAGISGGIDTGIKKTYNWIFGQ